MIVLRIRSKKKPDRTRAAVQAGAAALFCFLLPVRSLALDPAKTVLQYNCQTWTRQNGLPVNGINAVTQTQDGYLWLGTSGGLVRFDGIDFKLLDFAKVPQLPNTIVTSLASRQGSGLWVGLENSAFGFYGGETFSFRGKEAWGRVDMNVHSLLESRDGTLWLMAQRQVSKLTKGGGYEEVFGTSAEIAQNILCGYEDADGLIWVGTAADGIYYWQEGKVAHFPDPTLGDALIYCVVRDHGAMFVLEPPFKPGTPSAEKPPAGVPASTFNASPSWAGQPPR